MFRALVLLLIGTVFVINPSVAEDETTRQKKAADEKAVSPSIPSIDAAMQRFVESGEISGAVTLVGHQGKIVHLSAVGLADIESEKPMRGFSMFAIASMTKPITATAVMILQDEGELSVDDQVSKYIPEFKNLKLADGKRPRREITIRDCITHTSGLAGKQTFDGTLKEAVDDLVTRPLAFEPGTKWQYSPGLNVAGRIVEIVAKKPFHKFLQERIFEPCQMVTATFRPDAKKQRLIATIYQPNEDQSGLIAYDNHIADPADVRGSNPSGGLFSNARDLFRFYQMVLNDGKRRRKVIVSPEAVSKMTSPQTGELETGFTPGNCWGLGWCIVREPQGVTEMLSPGTFGHGGAFGTQGWVDPKTETVYVLLIQRAKMGNSDGSEIRKAFQQAAVDALEL